jgi:hypothetical protein
MAKERTRLSLDLEALFPGDSLTIGDQTIDIRPLGILQLSVIARKLKGFGAVLGEEGVSWDNYNQPENLLKLAVILLEQFPEVLEEASNIALEDLQQLPIDVIVEILDKVIDVNMKSKEKLEGNFKSLAQKFNMTKEKPKSQRRSKN